jgi:hypothetical protein
MEQKNTGYIAGIILLLIIIIAISFKNKHLKEEVAYWQDEHSATESDLEDLQYEHENLTTEYDDFKGCVEDRVYYEDYQEMRSTYTDCF